MFLSIGSSAKDVQYGSEVSFSFSGLDLAYQSWDVSGCDDSFTNDKSAYTRSHTIKIKIPQDLPCGLGTHKIEFEGKNTASDLPDKTVNVKSFNMDANKGNYITIKRWNESGSNLEEMRDFYLTNDAWNDDENRVNHFVEDGAGNGDLPDGGYALVAGNSDAANVWSSGVWAVDYGSIITTNGKLSDVISSGNRYDNPSEGWYVENKGFVLDSADAGFSSHNSNFGERYNGCITGTRFPLAAETKHNFDSCSPLHENGEYRPQGEIIKATEMGTPPYTDLDDVHSSDATNFYICRGDHSDGGYMGSTADESKIVKVQQDTSSPPDNKYYRCADGEGTGYWSGATEGRWEEFTCPPGKEVRDTGTGNNPYGCRTVSSGQSVDVNFFDLENVPESNRNGPLLGGFNISGSELNTFESALGHRVDTIEAECWLGQDDQRPGDGSQSVRITYDYADQSGGSPAWVLGKMPWRSNPDINKSTYSCVWGFTANIDDGDTNLLESTRRNPLNSKEASFTTTNHSLVKEKYETYSGSSISEETSSSVDIWDKYSGDDGRGSVDDTNEDMFSYSNAYPYCVTPTNPSGILSNIQCDSSGSVTASIDAEATTFEDGETIEFDASGSNSIKSIDSYNWDYGNGDTDTGATNQHSYSSTGTYTVLVTVEDVDGNTDTASTTIDIEDNVNTPGEFTVAYVPAYIQDSETTMYSNLVNSAHQSLEDNLQMDSSELTKYKVEQNTCHVTGCDGKGSCRQKAVDQCVNNGPIENDDYDLLHVICDNEDNYGGDSQPCGAQRGGVAKMAGDSAISLHNGDNSGYLGYGADYFGLSFSEVVVHEVGHNLGLEHVFNAEMLPDGALDVGELNIGDRVTDRTRTAAPGKGCYEVPDQYLKDDGSGWIVKAQHEEERGDGDRASPVSSTWKNLEDNNEGSDAINFFMSYCGVKDGFGPEAKEHMENNQLSGYQ